VVLTRTVEPGKAVAASLQAVTLFTVAEDLNKLRLEVAWTKPTSAPCRPARGQLHRQRLPSRRYPAGHRRVASTKTDNVVTYTTAWRWTTPT
jgi:HlyD family secretion protein